VGKITGGTYGIYTVGNLEIGVNTTVECATTDPTYYALHVDGTITLNNAVVLLPADGALETDGFTTVVDGSGNNAAHVKLGPATFESIYIMFWDKETPLTWRELTQPGKIPNWPANPTKPGYTFKGWIFADGEDTPVTPDTVFTHDCGVFAKWEENSGSTVPEPEPTVIVSEVKVEVTGEGTVKPSSTIAANHTTVTLEVGHEDGWELSALTATGAFVGDVPLTKLNETTWTFTMPFGDVTVKAEFTSVGGHTPSEDWNHAYAVCPKDHTCPIHPYKDLDPTAWYHDSLHFNIDNGLLIGYGNGVFLPEADASRAMVATALWRTQKCPVVNYLMLFEDVPAETWYTEAVRWATAEKLMAGKDTAFSPDAPVTRGELNALLKTFSAYSGKELTLDESGDPAEVLSRVDLAVALAGICLD